MPKKPETLAGLSNNLRSVAFRRSFQVDPINTLARVGIDTKDMERPLVDALAKLSPQELEFLADIQEKVDSPEIDKAGFVVGGVIF